VLCACCALAAGPHASRPQLARQLLASRRTPARRTPACLLLARAATRSSVLVRCVAGHLRYSVVRLIRFGGSPKPKPKPTTEIAKKLKPTPNRINQKPTVRFGSVIGFR